MASGHALQTNVTEMTALRRKLVLANQTGIQKLPFKTAVAARSGHAADYLLLTCVRVRFKDALKRCTRSENGV